jgi:uncharacterized protein
MHMAVSESDLDYLDKWLSSDESPPNSMMLSDLDGFLTAVAIGPEGILPSEWLPVLWGGGAPEFKGQMQAPRAMKTILGRYNEILSMLQTDPDALEPIFWLKDDGTVIVESWAMGFPDGIQLRLKQWVPLLKPGKQGVLIVPIAMHSFDKDGENVQEPLSTRFLMMRPISSARRSSTFTPTAVQGADRQRHIEMRTGTWTKRCARC